MLYTFNWKEFKKVRPIEVEKIKDYAVNVTIDKEDQNKGRDLTDPERNLWKYFIGKLAEYATYSFIFYSATTLISKPDLKIYPSSGDSGIDLICTASTGIYNLHVKSCTIQSQKDFGEAWLFSKKEKLVNNPKRNDLVVFTKEENNKIEIIKIMNAIDVMLCYTQPYNSNGYPIPKKWKIDYNDIRFEKDFKIV